MNIFMLIPTNDNNNTSRLSILIKKHIRTFAMSSGSPTMQRLYGPPKLSLTSTPNTSAVPPQATTKLVSRSDLSVISPTSLSCVSGNTSDPLSKEVIGFPIEKAWGRDKCLSPLKRTYSVIDYYSICLKFPRIIFIYKYLIRPALKNILTYFRSFIFD